MFVWPRSRSRLAARLRSSAISIDANALRARDAARGERGVERAALDERFEHALVDALGVDARREVEEVGERPAFLARLEQRLERRLAEAAHRAEPEADLRPARVLGDGGALAARGTLVAVRGACRRP